jgi:hypothetical protein
MYAERFGDAKYVERFLDAKSVEGFRDDKYLKRLGAWEMPSKQ